MGSPPYRETVTLFPGVRCRKLSPALRSLMRGWEAPHKTLGINKKQGKGIKEKENNVKGEGDEKEEGNRGERRGPKGKRQKGSAKNRK